ncbi:MAG: metallophosphoesterase [Ruminococcaceae bacterium]|nr:metallophosphoesterase [Oscillospiraceae bacterium]
MDIIELNRHKEQDLLDATGVTFVHFSDIHARKDLWDRIVTYINRYADRIDFALHTGDYCGGSQRQYADLYMGIPCKRPIYNCVGNHDCYAGRGAWLLTEKEIPHRLLFNHTENWDATFFDCDHSMSYYIDRGELRLIVLDDYYHTWQTRPWLRALLRDAFEKGLHVITAQHEPTGYISDSFGVPFQTLDDYNAKFRQYELKRTTYDYDHRCRVLYEDVIEEFIAYGGRYVCNLAGHDHVDQLGLTARGVLNVAVQNATSWDALGDTARVAGTQSEDCFNVMSVDTAKGEFRLLRIGADTDRYGRTKGLLVFDYVRQRVIKKQ